MIRNYLHKCKLALVLIVIAALHTPPAGAAVPKLLTYNGLLKNAAGSYLNSSYSIRFCLYTAATGGTAIWTETQPSVTVTSGRFSVQLGSVTPLNLDFTQNYWLGVKVGADAEMTPRQRLTSVGYAYMADQVANGFTQAQHDALSHKDVEGVQDNTINIAKTNFKLDAYSMASANSMGDMVVDTFNDASGVQAASSTNYQWRGVPDYDISVMPASGGNDSNTKLLLHLNGTSGSTTFTDSSSLNQGITFNGNVSISTAQSKFGGASASFGGFDNYLIIQDHSAYDFSTGIWTVDFWLRPNSISAQTLFGQVQDGNNFFGILLEADGSIHLKAYAAGSQNVEVRTPAGAAAANAWSHIAVVENGNTYKIFVNGAEKISVTDTDRIMNYTGQLRIGHSSVESGGTPLNGYVDEFRFSNVARWAAAFTPPSAEYVAPVPGGTATVVSIPFTEPVAPIEAMIIADETLNTGTITYYVSRDNGTTWTAAPRDTIVNVSAQPSGTQLRWKAVITGNAELNSIAIAV